MSAPLPGIGSFLVMDYHGKTEEKETGNYMVEDEETGRKGCIHTSSDAENPH